MIAEGMPGYVDPAEADRLQVTLFFEGAELFAKLKAGTKVRVAPGRRRSKAHGRADRGGDRRNQVGEPCPNRDLEIGTADRQCLYVSGLAQSLERMSGLRRPRPPASANPRRQRGISAPASRSVPRPIALNLWPLCSTRYNWQRRRKDLWIPPTIAIVWPRKPRQ